MSQYTIFQLLLFYYRSPLLLGASRAAWKTVLSLIRLGAQITIKDVNARNVLHLVIMNGGRLDEFAREVSRSQYSSQLQNLLNEKDDTGCSSLHYASREGHIRSLENLIRLGACINLKNNNNESALVKWLNLVGLMSKSIKSITRPPGLILIY